MKHLNHILHDDILSSSDFAMILRGMAQTGFLEEEIPEIATCYNFNQHNPNHTFDVFEHILATISNIDSSFKFLQKNNILLNYAEYAFTAKIALLLHDIAKPKCFVLREGRGTFYGHAEEGAIMAGTILKRLKITGLCDSKVTFLIENHMSLRELFRAKDKTIIKYIKYLGVDNLPYVLGLTYCDLSGKGLPEKAKIDLRELQKFTTRLLSIVQNNIVKQYCAV